jgi:hypothetical protein
MVRIFIICFLFSPFVYGQMPKELSRPEKDFETFWTTFKDNYAFFKLKGVDWDSAYTKFRPQVTKTTKEKQLIEILGQMVEPLKDGHITISRGEKILYKTQKPSAFREEFKDLKKEFWQTVGATLVQNGFSQPMGVGAVFRDEHLYYVAKTEQIGYIRISRCFAEVKSIIHESKELADTNLMLSLFDSLLRHVSNTQTLIIDVRGNGGGHGGLELASRLTKTKTLTHYKAIKQKGSYDSFSTLEPQFIAPHNGTQYLKQIIILTNDKTASSAEDFTISLYQQPHVTTIGTNTSGMLSDMFEAKLSNKIAFTLSNQVYYSTEKEILENKGVQVHVEVKNTKQDIEAKQDAVLMKALKVMRERNK